MKRAGTRQEVWDGAALKTRGGLTKENLMLNKRNKIVSIRRSELAKKNANRLTKHAFKKKPVVGARSCVQKETPKSKLLAVTKRRKKELPEK